MVTHARRATGLPPKPTWSSVNIKQALAVPSRPPTSQVGLGQQLIHLPCSLCPGGTCVHKHFATFIWHPVLAEPHRAPTARQKALRAMQRHERLTAEQGTDLDDEELDEYEENMMHFLDRDAHDRASDRRGEDDIDDDEVDLRADDSAVVGPSTNEGDQPSISAAPDHTTDSDDAQPPRKKRKIPREFFNHRKVIFPPAPAYKGKSIIDMPNEVLTLIFREMSPPELVHLTKTCHRVYDLLRQPYADIAIWGYSRLGFGEMPGPHACLKDSHGCSLSEMRWAFLWFSGGPCELCGEWAAVPPLSFALTGTVRICPREECRRHWRAQLEAGTKKRFDWIRLTANEPVPKKKRDPTTTQSDQQNQGADVEMDDAETVAHDRGISSKLQNKKLLWRYICSHPRFLVALRERFQDQQHAWLHSVLHMAVKNPESIGMGLTEPPPQKVLNILDDYMSANNQRKRNKISPFPETLVDFTQIDFPDDTIRELVRNGMRWVEHAYLNPRWDFGHESKVQKLYRITDVQNALDEWIESGFDGTRAEVILKWKNAAMHVQEAMWHSHYLSNWREGRKGWRGTVRTNNDNMYRKAIRDLDKERQQRWEARCRAVSEAPARPIPLNWEDASNSPTLKRIKAEIEAYGVINARHIWKKHEAEIVAETEKLRTRRMRRMHEQKIRDRRRVAKAFWLYLRRNKEAPLKAGVKASTVIPAFRIFNTFPVVQRLPDTLKEVKNWDTWLVHAYLELNAWEAELTKLLPEVARLDACRADHLSRVDCVFRCLACDRAAVEHHSNRFTTSKSAGPGKRLPSTAMPPFKQSMTYKEIVEHECVERWDVNNCVIDAPGCSLARHACNLLNISPKETSQEDLHNFKKAWKCETCEVWLSWHEVYPHQLRHAWYAEKELRFTGLPHEPVGSLAKGLFERQIVASEPHRDVRKPRPEVWQIRATTRSLQSMSSALAVPTPVGHEIVPPNFCRKMLRASDEERRNTNVMCGICTAAARRNHPMGKDMLKAKILKYDGMRDHLQQRHGWAEIHTEDIILINSGLKK
ncbi:hypothetical protein CALVIDRAFT_541310 [Calocera viscosa TUFC12733]|uniref:F-box domain-containing protein n=1 Tax=Calocera viscosa (strain TUFC12733) TaxID=1330018 RepID=A0A167HYZ7_CALVF|nr:hypothetical protein CALVIDRAFT_541310 [Calocera viscosa TUFC12733]